MKIFGQTIKGLIGAGLMFLYWQVVPLVFWICVVFLVLLILDTYLPP